MPKVEEVIEQDVQPTGTGPEGGTQVRDEIRAWLADQWDPEITLQEWWGRLFEGRWTAPTWPVDRYGRGLSGDLNRVIDEELRAAGAAAGPGGLGILLAGPTIAAHGTEEQRERYLPAILKGEEAWCQLFSEPNAGSDLAGLQARAVPDGPPTEEVEWVVTGQKVWSSGAQHSQLGMLIARTDSALPKHQGITWFVIEMDQPGVEVRPIREMTGRALFNEVFLDGARVKPGCVVGGIGNGWAVANTTLAAERAGLGGGSDAAGGTPAGPTAGNLERRAGDFAPRSGGRSGTGQVFRSGSSGLMMKQAQELEKSDDPVIRQEIAKLYSLEQISKYTALRVKAASKAGKGPGAEVSTMKLNMSRITRQGRETGLAILGAHGMLMGRDSASHGIIQEMALFSPAPSIYGGTDQIQRNIIGERVLGLPREPREDKDVAFKDLMQNRLDVAG